MYNMNQPFMSSWEYPAQYDPFPQSYDDNFQNQFSYSRFQEEPIAQSMKDMIKTQNFVTPSTGRLESTMSELVNAYSKGETLFYQPLIDPNTVSYTHLTLPTIYSV